MPLQNQVSPRLSARAVYKRNSIPVEPEPEVPRRGRGRPRKYALPVEEPLPKEPQKQDKTVVRKGKVTQIKRGRARVVDNSLGADSSSEVEEGTDSEVDEESVEGDDEESVSDEHEEELSDESEEDSNEDNKSDEEEGSDEGESNEFSEEIGIDGEDIDDDEEDDGVRYSLAEQENIKPGRKKRELSIKKSTETKITSPPLGKKPKNKTKGKEDLVEPIHLELDKHKVLKSNAGEEKESSSLESKLKDKKRDEFNRDEQRHFSPDKQKDGGNLHNKSVEPVKRGRDAVSEERSRSYDEEEDGDFAAEINAAPDGFGNKKRKFELNNGTDQITAKPEPQDVCDKSFDLTSAHSMPTKKKKISTDNSFRHFNGSTVKDRLPPISNSTLFRENGFPSLLNRFNSKPTISTYFELNRSVTCGNIAAEESFRWLIKPLAPNYFLQNIFEKMPYHVPRSKSNYYQDLFNCDDFNTLLKENNLHYNEHIDVVKYELFQRCPLEAVGKAYYSNVWDDYKKGYSVRLRNPQAYNNKLWNLCALLQEYFSSSVGVNAYLTPPGSQGFPPHYDDIDAFITQIEGSKDWKVYRPRNMQENLARYSSKDFTQEEIGQPMLEVCLKAGDMLYIPRGYIHQAETNGDDHSLHLTFSTNQLNTWGDFLMQAMGKAVEKAICSETELRKSLPKDYIDYVGTAAPKCESTQRSAFTSKLFSLAKLSLKYLSADEGADAQGLKFIHSSLPPVFNKAEKDHSIHGNGSRWKYGGVRLIADLDLSTRIQLIRKRNLRLVIEDGAKIYHTLENSRDGQAMGEGDNYEAVYMEIEMDQVPAFTYLLQRHPQFVRVKDLPFTKKSAKIGFANDLYEGGILVTEEPLELKIDDPDSLSSNDEGSDVAIKEENF